MLSLFRAQVPQPVERAYVSGPMEQSAPGSLFPARLFIQAPVPLIILGGMLYHLLFEAKSQHSQGYFILMLPVAAYGFAKWFEYLRDNKAQ